MSSFNLPFARENELNHELGIHREPWQSVQSLALPGFPNVTLTPLTTLLKHLEDELCSKDLEVLAPKLWMMSLRSSDNISPLHHQKVKGRSIVISEDPKLHLVWHTDVIFIKPLPPYLVSWEFWHSVLAPHPDTSLDARITDIRRWALGFLRTYAHLIKRKSDFNIAQSNDLVPADVDWASFCRFSRCLLDIPDDCVSPRYIYGELRLARLNFYTKLFLRKLRFHRIHRRYSTYFAHFFGPILFVLGLLSVMLSAMQATGASQILIEKHPGSYLWRLCKWFSATTFSSVALVCCCLTLVFLFKLAREWQHAVRHRHGGASATVRSKADKVDAGEGV